ncbi:MAG TPA: molybdate ABC transporter substrate-binding protein [Mycobacteriales bacterium]|nr:molybdate ABC transporter substrate-binding protein [Mycobacteriales bacterium]
MTAIRAAVVGAVVLAAGCAGAGTPAGSGAASGGAGRITVFAASSLTDAFPAVAAAYRRTPDGGPARFSFAGSQELVAQISNGAPADVIATADNTTMRRITARLVAPPQTFAHNQLVIVTRPGNPHHIRSLADLAAPGIVVVLAAPVVPAGNYAQIALDRARVHVSPKSLETDVRGVLTKVELGEADAGIVYRTDALAAAGKVHAVPIPDAPTAAYEIGALDRAGRGFVDFVLSAAGQQVLRRFGFSP